MPPEQAAAHAKPDPLGVLQQLRAVMRVAQRHSENVERSTGLSGSQLWALYEVSQAPGLHVGGLAARMRLHHSTTSNLVERLCAADLLCKTRAGADQRVVCLSLTSQGEALLARAPTPHRGILPEVLGSLPEAELRQLSEALAVLTARLETDAAATLQPLPFTE